jgi:hypothetical protein
VYLLANGWLIQYPEHIGFSLWFVVAPFLVMTILVVFTSISQTLKAALKNPVDSLKQE